MSDATRQLAQTTLSVNACEKRRRKQATQQLVRGGAIACFFLCIMLLVAMLHLNRLPIREIVFVGNEHYSSAELQQIFPQNIGEPLHLVNQEAVREQMLSACAYLSGIDVQTSLRGVITITVRERIPLWALRYDIDANKVGYVILDEDLRALEYTENSSTACVVICPGIVLPRVGETLPEAAARREQAYIDEKLAEGVKKKDIQPPPYISSVQRLQERLACIARSMDEIRQISAAAAVDFSAAYDYTLAFQDGSLLRLGNADKLETQISYAISAMQNYRMEQGEAFSNVPLMVDVRDISRVFVREISSAP